MLKPRIIIIPVYKSKTIRSEIASFNQCLKILFKHPICIITYKGLDTSFYTDLMVTAKVNFQIEYFAKKYFENLAGYNRLMLSLDFYKRFEDFEYMLIYQLDSWVFMDELDYWCSKEYDYIGAPWFENFGSYKMAIS